MALSKSQVSQLYVSIFNRASEGAGNTFWQAEADQATAANAMLATSAASTYFGTSLNSNQAFVEHIYLNTLGKTLAQDPDGIAFWVKALTDGNSRGFVVAELIKSATDAATAGAAQDQFNNRVEVSNYMAATVQTAPADYATSTAFKSAAKPTGALDVTNDDATVTTAKAAVNGLNGGQIFTLTTGTDVPALTTGTDTVNGAINTLTVNDSIVDTSTTDNDTLNVELLGGAAIGSTTKVTNVENLNFSVLSGTATVDVSGMTGYKAIYSNSSTEILSVANISDLTDTYGLKSSTGGLTLAFTAAAVASGNDSMTVTLDGVTNGGILDIDNVNGLETLNIALVGGATKVADVQTGAATTTVAITGNQEFTNSAAAGFDTTVTTVDARGTSKSTFEVSAATVAVLTGSGDDSITKGTAAIAAGDLFNLGAGTNTLTTQDAAGTGATATYIGVDKIVSKVASDNFDMTNSDGATAFDFQGGTTLTALNMVSGSTVKNSTLASTAVAIGFQGTVMGEATTLDLTKGATTSVAATNVKTLTVNYGATSTGAIALDSTAGGTEVTTGLVVNANAGTFTGGAITTATKLTDLTYNIASGVIGAGTTTYAAADALTNFTVNANAAVAFGAIGNGTASAKLASIDINATAGNVTLAQIDAANATGITTISLDAVGGTINSGTAIVNTGGNIGTVTMTGSKAIAQDFTVTVGNVNTITSTATGGVTSTVTNAGAAASTGSTITLGDAAFGKSNAITMAGTNVKNTITGGSGVDTIVSVDGADTISLGAGNDTVTAAGGADTVTLGAGADTYIFAAAGTTGTGGTTAAALANAHDVIVDYKGAATDGDIIDGGAILITNASAAAGASVAATNAAGLVTSWATTASSATLADKITIVEATIDAGTNALNEALLFVDSGKTYLFISDGVSGIAAADMLIELTGISASTGITLSGGDIINIA